MSTAPLSRLKEDAHASPQPITGVYSFFEAHEILALVLFTVLYWLGVWSANQRIPMHIDEIWTVLLAQLPDVHSLLSAMRQGIESQPPLYFIMAHLSQSLLGPTDLAARLPAAFGFWLMSISLFFFVRRRAGAGFGLIAAVCPQFTFASEYAQKARPYGAELGAAGLALLCWQSAGESRNRMVALIGLALSTAALVNLHYYAVYVVAAIALGECVRTWKESRKPDLKVWLSLAIGSMAIIPDFPMIRAIHATRVGFWAKPTNLELGETYTGLMSLAFVIIFVALAAMAIRLGNSGPLDLRGRGHGLPAQEWIICVALLLMPVVVFVLARLWTHAYLPRYVLPSVIGFSVVLPMALANVSHTFPRMPAIILASAACLFILLEARQVLDAKRWSMTREEWVRRNNWVPLKEDLPAVIDDDARFMQIVHYGTPEMRRRTYFLSDENFIEKTVGITVGALYLEDGGRNPVAPPNVVDYRDFVNRHASFYLVRYAGPSVLKWTARHLVADGAVMELVDMSSDETEHEILTYLVHYPRDRQQR